MDDMHSVSHTALQSYIDSARKLSIYGGEAGWQSNIWHTKSLRKNVTMSFCELRPRSQRAFVPLKSPFLEFAKAYVRHVQSEKEKGSIFDVIAALRFLYAALGEVYGECDVLKVDGAVQEMTREKITTWFSSKSPMRYRIGLQLMLLYTELQDRGIAPTLPHWQSPWKLGVQKQLSMDAESVEWRKAKTPDDQKMAAVLAAFELAQRDKDQYWTSLALMLAFASGRGGELCDLSVDSLIDEPYTNQYGQTKRRVGLRWFSEKGFDANVKWVPRLKTSNGDEAREALLMNMVVRAFKRLVRLSEPARKSAKLAHDTMGAVYPIGEFCLTPTDYPQDRVLTDMEAAHAMRRTATLNRTGTQFWPSQRMKKYFAWHWPSVEHGNPTYQDIAQADYQYFTAKLSHWPYTSNSEQVKVWESLVLHQWNQFSDNPYNDVYPNSYCLPDTSKMCVQLSGRSGMTSLFDRLELTMDDGSKIQLKTHDFRRWHGTRGRALAYMGLSEHRLRMLAGRKDIRQNDAYDFNTPEQKAAQYRQLIATSSDNPSLYERLTLGTPIYRHELLSRPLGNHEVPQPIQVGPFGSCTHSIAEPPCMKGGDCLTCTEKKYIKGTPGCLERLRESATQHKSEFDALEAWQKKRDQLGLDQWMTYNVIRYAIAESLVRQMEDPTIPDGTVLGIDEHFDPSPLKVNLMAKGIEVLDQPQDRVAQEINQLLGMVDDA